MKKEWKWFSVFNHEKEQEYLSEQHRNGWKFKKVCVRFSGYIYHTKDK